MPTKKLRRIAPSPKPPSKQDMEVPEEAVTKPIRMPRAYPMEGPIEELPAPPVKNKRRIGSNV